ncbi:ribosomal L29e protein family-domain-containing protein [Xylaria venustula]|nr:ribosomal L29e protein family-domain-containing protein [Xylaria venustula]
MAKSKNSSQHNQSKKAHRNGIKKPKTNRYPSLKGTDPKFRRNHRYALHGTMRALRRRKANAKRFNESTGRYWGYDAADGQQGTFGKTCGHEHGVNGLAFVYGRHERLSSQKNEATVERSRLLLSPGYIQ